MSIESLVLCYVVVFVASFVNSLTGFGFGLTAAPFLLFFIEPKSVVVINLSLAIVICLFISKRSWSRIKMNTVKLLFLVVYLACPLVY